MQTSTSKTGATTYARPNWWNDTHDSAWERVKDALKRDWDQTRRDFGSKKVPELNQDVDDTVRQALGKQAVPPQNVPNPPDADDFPEDAVRYGYGVGMADQYRTHTAWGEPLEGSLRQEWTELKYGRKWEDVKDDVRRGFERARTAVQSHV